MGEGYAFNTLIGQGEPGTLGRGINSEWATQLAGKQAVTLENLTNAATFKLSEEQAKAFIDAQLREYRYNGEKNPDAYDKIHSPLGMKLFEQAVPLLGMEKGSALIAAAKAKNIDTNAAYWTEFQKALTAVEDGKTYISETGFTVIPHRDMVMGLLESCRNFTVATNETLETHDNNRVGAIDTHQTVNGIQGVGYTSADAAIIPEKKANASEGGDAEEIDERKKDGDKTTNHSSTLN